MLSPNIPTSVGSSSLAKRALVTSSNFRWLTPRHTDLGLDEKGMGFHAFKRFRKTWLRGQRCLEDINNFWMPHRPQTMAELYSHLHEELQLRLDEAERVGYGFVLPLKETSIIPMIPKSQSENVGEIAA